MEGGSLATWEGREGGAGCRVQTACSRGVCVSVRVCVQPEGVPACATVVPISSIRGSGTDWYSK